MHLLLLISLTTASAQEPTPVADAVRTALSSGDCDRALVISSERVTAAPDDAEAHRLRGDAQRCLGQNRAAVLSYRRAMQLGVDDAVLEQLVGRLAKKLVQLELTAQGADWDHPPEITLHLDGATLEPISAGAQGVRFIDLPPNQPLEIRLHGPGYQPTVTSVDPQQAGAVAQRTVEVDYLGLGTLVLSPWEGDHSVTITDGHRKREGVEPGSHEVTAGNVVVTIQGQLGRAERTLGFARGQELSLDVASLLPGQVTLTQVPAGSTLRYGLTGGSDYQEIEIGWPEVTLDPEIGLPILSAYPLENLQTGSYGYELAQPSLGMIQGEFFAVGGEVSAHRIDLGSAPGFEPLRGAYASHLDQLEATRGLGKHGRRATIGAGVSSGLLAGTIVAVARGVTTQRDLATLNDLYDEALAEGRTSEANDHYTNRAKARSAATTDWITAGACATASSVSLGFTFSQLGKAKAQRVQLPAWDPTGLPPLQPEADAPPTEQGAPPPAEPREPTAVDQPDDAGQPEGEG
jgi:hypothetical protein